MTLSTGKTTAKAIHLRAGSFPDCVSESTERAARNEGVSGDYAARLVRERREWPMTDDEDAVTCGSCLRHLRRTQHREHQTRQVSAGECFSE